MNAPHHTRAAEGWDRRAFTVEEIWAMTRAGILDESAPFELWEGELVPMNAKHNRHEIWKRALAKLLYRGLPDDIAVAIEPSLYLSDVTFLEPDVLIHPAAVLPVEVRGPDVLLAIEVADSSVRRDLTVKARLCARYGVAHHWVLGAENRRAHLLSAPTPDGYATTAVVESDGEVTLPFDPALVIRLAELG